MSRRRRPSGSLIDDIVAVAAHQTEEVEFLRSVIEQASQAALAGLCCRETDDHRNALTYIKLLCSEALSMQGGAN